MTVFVFRCPNTGMNVQGWVADDPTEREDDAYEATPRDHNWIGAPWQEQAHGARFRAAP